MSEYGVCERCDAPLSGDECGKSLCDVCDGADDDEAVDDYYEACDECGERYYACRCDGPDEIDADDDGDEDQCPE